MALALAFPVYDCMATRRSAMTLRPLLRVHPAERDDIGDLVTRRPLPGPSISSIDPFLFLNHHGPQSYPPGNSGLPFGPHPHRGFETVTFVLEGEIAHRDSAGHESVIGAGGIQWMTAGRGLVHEEVSPAAFKQNGGPLEILQLWVNLPARLKMTEPRYLGLQRHAIPACRTEDGRGTINLIAGRHEGHAGPVLSLTGVFMSTVELGVDARATFSDLGGRNLFVYVVRGAVSVGRDKIPAFHLAEFAPQGDTVQLDAREESIVIFGHANPIREAVVVHGPFVMNTREEIVEAVRDYESGRFGTPFA